MLSYEGSFRSINEVSNKIMYAMDNKIGLSLVRCGDGEAFAMGYDLVPNYQQVAKQYDYAGIPAASPLIKNSLLKALSLADIVGLSNNRDVFLCGPLLEQIIERNRLKLPFICNARINWELHGGGSGPLYKLLKGKRVLVVGRLARQALPRMRRLGLTVVKTLSLEGFNQLHPVYNTIKSYARSFDVALVAAGIPAVPLCVRIAKECNKVAIDFGHAINDFVMPGFNESHLRGTTEEWRRRYHRQFR